MFLSVQRLADQRSSDSRNFTLVVDVAILLRSVHRGVAPVRVG